MVLRNVRRHMHWRVIAHVHGTHRTNSQTRALYHPFSAEKMKICPISSNVVMHGLVVLALAGSSVAAVGSTAWSDGDLVFVVRLCACAPPSHASVLPPIG